MASTLGQRLFGCLRRKARRRAPSYRSEVLCLLGADQLQRYKAQQNKRRLTPLFFGSYQCRNRLVSLQRGKCGPRRDEPC